MNDIIALKNRVAEVITEAVEQAQQDGKLPVFSVPEIILEHPQNPSHGDYATNIALKLARTLGMNPMVIARELAGFIRIPPEIEKITVAPPGFINFNLKIEWLLQQIDYILREKDDYGNLDVGENHRVQIEFVSANPTGPLHVGHGRGAVLGSTLANCLKSAGFQVVKEYYINDAGAQIAAFNNTLYARYKQNLGVAAELPQNGYMGSYMIDLAKEIITEKGDVFLSMPESEAVKQLGDIGLRKMLERIKSVLELLDVSFDNWFSERSLFTGGQYQKALDILTEKGFIARRDGAVWFISTVLGEDKDNVIVRSDGTPTYFGTDIAYHYEKFLERKFDKVIDIWGADHQGHVSRMKAVLGALGIDPERLTVIISQMITLKRGGELVKLSKRTGDMITLDEVINEVGKDACRFMFLSRSADAQMDFDLDLVRRESPENPVYYVQYAHARIASIMRLAEEKEIDFSDGDVSRLKHPAEIALLKKVILLPEIIGIIAQTLQPHHIAYYAQDLATIFHSFYNQCRVVTDDEEGTKARLKLVRATQITLAKVLSLMGMSVRDRM